MRIIRDPLLIADRSVSAESALEVFNVLTEVPERFIEEGWSKEEVFWSRYFWVRVHANLVIAKEGPDAGLEQFAFKVLEHPWPQCDPDWSHAKLVDSLAAQVTSK